MDLSLISEWYTQPWIMLANSEFVRFEWGQIIGNILSAFQRIKFRLKLNLFYNSAIVSSWMSFQNKREFHANSSSPCTYTFLKHSWYILDTNTMNVRITLSQVFENVLWWSLDDAGEYWHRNGQNLNYSKLVSHRKRAINYCKWIISSAKCKKIHKSCLLIALGMALFMKLCISIAWFFYFIAFL